MAIEKIDFELCTGCGMCENYCPVDVIRFDNTTRKPEIKYLEDCMLCGLCEDRCHVKAIKVGPNKNSPLILSWS
jgi:NAD-dependent dihydropyrimidine dehydrogenase PreA subunit